MDFLLKLPGYCSVNKEITSSSANSKGDDLKCGCSVVFWHIFKEHFGVIKVGATTTIFSIRRDLWKTYNFYVQIWVRNCLDLYCGQNCVSGLPRWQSGKVSACRYRRHKRLEFDAWVGMIPWNRKWQPTLVSVPGKFHGQRSQAGYSPQGRKESDMTEYTHMHTVCVYPHERLKDPFEDFISNRAVCSLAGSKVS